VLAGIEKEDAKAVGLVRRELGQGVLRLVRVAPSAAEKAVWRARPGLRWEDAGRTVRHLKHEKKVFDQDLIESLLFYSDCQMFCISKGTNFHSESSEVLTA
jgi:hypothetical protein